MKITLPADADASIIEKAAEKIGARAVNTVSGTRNTRAYGRRLVAEGTRLVVSGDDERYRARRGTFDGTIGALKGDKICWHGFRDFMRAIYAEYPDTVIEAGYRGKVVYQGSEHFEEIHVDTYPDMRTETCRCTD